MKTVRWILHHDLHTGENFAIRPVCEKLVRTVYPSFSEEDTHALIERAEARLQGFADRTWLEPLMLKRSPPGAASIQAFLERLAGWTRDPSQQWVYVRYVIGEIVEREYGEPERQKYIVATLQGQAN